MSEGRKMNRKSYSTCLSLGMLFGVVLGSAMKNVALGLAIGFMCGTVYFLLFQKHGSNEDDSDGNA